ncbi:MAG: hypothetical protein WBQ36_13445, partial [Desulfobaccales bacterium]
MSRTYASLTSRLVLLSFLAVFACAAPAQAVMIWDLTGTFTDGGTINGTVFYLGGNNLSAEVTVTLPPGAAEPGTENPYEGYMGGVVSLYSTPTLTTLEFGDNETSGPFINYLLF